MQVYLVKFCDFIQVHVFTTNHHLKEYVYISKKGNSDLKLSVTRPSETSSKVYVYIFTASVAHWVKRCSTDLAFPNSSPARGVIFSAVIGVPLHTACLYHPPIVLIILKHC